MRGEQRAVGIERIDLDAPPNLRFQYVCVLALVSVYIALVLTSVFIMDWFVIGPPGGNQSIDLWAVSSCDVSFGCVSTPLERAGYFAYRPFAVLTLWLTATSSMALLVRTGAFLFGARIWSHVSGLVYILLGASALSVLMTIFAVPPQPGHFSTAHPSPAPFILIAAHIVGILAMTLATSDTRSARCASNVPLARVVRS